MLTVKGARRLLAPAVFMIAGTIALTGCPSAGTGNLTGALGAGGSAESSAPPTAGSSTVTPIPTDPAVATGGTTGPPNNSDAVVSPVPTLAPIVVPLAPGVSDEASGIAASTTTPGAYYLVDDATGTDDIVAVGTDGAVLARIAVEGMSADNAEALSSGTCGAVPLPDEASSSGNPADNCLYVGDIGDNKASRDDVTVYRFAEPNLADLPIGAVPADEWRYTYPDGAQNAEAMLVDTDGSLIIVTKPPAEGALPHRMYRATPGGGELVFIREFSPPAPAHPFKTLFTGNVVTDLATSAGRVLLLTYDDVQEYTTADPAAALSTFPDWPHRPVPLPTLPQAEGITGTADGCGYVVASESGPGGKAGSLGIVSCG